MSLPVLASAASAAPAAGTFLLAKFEALSRSERLRQSVQKALQTLSRGQPLSYLGVMYVARDPADSANRSSQAWARDVAEQLETLPEISCETEVGTGLRWYFLSSFDSLRDATLSWNESDKGGKKAEREESDGGGFDSETAPARSSKPPLSEEEAIAAAKKERGDAKGRLKVAAAVFLRASAAAMAAGLPPPSAAPEVLAASKKLEARAQRKQAKVAAVAAAAAAKAAAKAAKAAKAAHFPDLASR